MEWLRTALCVCVYGEWGGLNKCKWWTSVLLCIVLRCCVCFLRLCSIRHVVGRVGHTYWDGCVRVASMSKCFIIFIMLLMTLGLREIVYACQMTYQWNWRETEWRCDRYGLSVFDIVKLLQMGIVIFAKNNFVK